MLKENTGERSCIGIEDGTVVIVVCHTCRKPIYHSMKKDRITMHVAANAALRHVASFTAPHNVSVFSHNEELLCANPSLDGTEDCVDIISLPLIS